MNIGYFTSAFPYKNPLTGEPTGSYVGGGVENVAYNLAVEMLKKGHNISIFTSSIDTIDSVEDYGQIIIYRYKKSVIIGEASTSIGLFFKPLFTSLDLDIIHSHMGNLPAPLTAHLVSKKNKTPIIVTYHADWIGGFGGLIRRSCVFVFNKIICNNLLSQSDLIIALSDYQVNESTHLSKHANKILTIPNGINLNEFEENISKNECREKLNLPLNKKIILFVGSLTPRKGPHILIQAMKKVISTIPDSYLIFVGDGTLKTDLNDLANNLNLGNDISFVGFVDEKSKLLYYKASDIFALPSFHESFGIVLLEASACGLPLVVSDLEAFKAIINDGQNGLFTKMGDDDDLADKLIYLLKNDDVRVKMGNNARSNVSEFSWDKVAESTEKAYLKLISDKL